MAPASMPDFLDLAGHHGFTPRACRPAGPDEGQRRADGGVHQAALLRAVSRLLRWAHLNQPAEQWLRRKGPARARDGHDSSRRSLCPRGCCDASSRSRAGAADGPRRRSRRTSPCGCCRTRPARCGGQCRSHTGLEEPSVTPVGCKEGRPQSSLSTRTGSTRAARRAGM
jgi:hypothetical protein